MKVIKEVWSYKDFNGKQRHAITLNDGSKVSILPKAFNHMLPDIGMEF